ncbi:MAG: DoxX family membrane protein [Dehalococcoidia bacterium]|nr:DoxX family membrane protein [Chloroflexota bacterium]MCK4242684.1 DoxX family membrane protein [Dehalococcoidia bacterium]
MNAVGIKAKRVGRLLRHPYLTLVSRMGLAGVFIFAGMAKLPYVDTLIWEIKQYHILPHSLANAYGHVLPTLEIALGILLVMGLFLRISASVSVLVVLSFTIAKIVALARGLDISICGCFGSAGELLALHSLIIDFVLLALAFQILFHRGEFLSLGHLLSRKAEPSGEP